jgi:hypothetical protein
MGLCPPFIKDKIDLSIIWCEDLEIYFDLYRVMPRFLTFFKPEASFLDWRGQYIPEPDVRTWRWTLCSDQQAALEAQAVEETADYIVAGFRYW